MAICERTDTKARCTIFNLTSRMKLRVIPEVEHEADFNSNVFYGAAFCPKDPARYIVTLCGEPDWVVHLWQHDIFKLHCRIEIGAQLGNTFQISESKCTELTVVVTGPQCFRFFTINEGNNGFKMIHSELTPRAKNVSILSDDYTCHAWDQASKLVVCTAHGEIIICDYDGFAHYYLSDSPFHNRIDCIFTTDRHLIVAGASSLIWSYELTALDGSPYQLHQSHIGINDSPNAQ
jgi:hypothetical protein